MNWTNAAPPHPNLFNPPSTLMLPRGLRPHVGPCVVLAPVRDADGARTSQFSCAVPDFVFVQKNCDRANEGFMGAVFPVSRQVGSSSECTFAHRTYVHRGCVVVASTVLFRSGLVAL